MAMHDDGEARASDFAAVVPTASERTRRMRLLRRIADALQVPQASLYGTVHAPQSPGDGASAPDQDLDGQCDALLNAYRRIRDPAERQRLLALVQATAGRT